MRNPFFAGLALGLTLLAVSPAEARVEVGILRCTVSGGVGYLLGSSKPMRCTFSHNSGPPEYYEGRVTKIGIDIGYTKETHIAWAVLAPTRDVPPRSLDGRCAGVTAEATVGGGVGANVLLGGSRRSIMLQPLSVQTQTGLNIAAGVAGLRLRAVGY